MKGKIKQVEIKQKPEKERQEHHVKEKIKPFKATIVGERIVSVDKEAKRLYDMSNFGEIAEDKVYYSLVESLYLLEKKKIKIYDCRKALNFDVLLKKASTLEPNFYTRFRVFRDMRNKGYIIKTALKFGADFRVYDRGIKPGQEHARWILYPVYEGSHLTWHEFAAKNRVAHSTRKRLLMGVVDDEGDVTYWEIRWMRP
ncbi:MAG: tRNA-intron lyase [Nanoarchaeota archaeon]